MSERTTRCQLEHQVASLNRLLGRPEAPWTQREDGKGCRANVGNLHLDHCLGGWQVQEMVSDGGGVTCPLGDARHTAGEMWHVLRAAVGAVQMAQESAQQQQPAEEFAQ